MIKIHVVGLDIKYLGYIKRLEMIKGSLLPKSRQQKDPY